METHPERTTLAERFWHIAPAEFDDSDRQPPQVVAHLVAILHRLRDLELERDRDATVATLSLLTLVRQQEALGDLNYASPEQLRGEPLGEPSLVFSVGVLLFEHLCRRHPFSAEESPLRFIRMRKAELGSGVNFFPFVPNGLRPLLSRALCSRPEDRQQTLAELAEDLVRFLHPKKRRPVTRTSPPLETPRAVPSPSLSVGEKIGLLLTTPGSDDPTVREIELTAEPATEDEEEPAAPPRRRAPRWVWAAAGVTACALVLAGIIVAQQRRAHEPAPLQPVVAAASAPELPAPEVTPVEKAAPFDPEAAGQAALQALGQCFSPFERSKTGFSFGLSLLYTPEGERSTKVYFPHEAELDPMHVGCLSQVLRGVSAGGRPDHVVAVVLRFSVKGDTLGVSVVGTNP